MHCLFYIIILLLVVVEPVTSIVSPMPNPLGDQSQENAKKW